MAGAEMDRGWRGKPLTGVQQLRACRIAIGTVNALCDVRAMNTCPWTPARWQRHAAGGEHGDGASIVIERCGSTRGIADDRGQWRRRTGQFADRERRHGPSRIAITSCRSSRPPPEEPPPNPPARELPLERPLPDDRPPEPPRGISPSQRSSDFGPHLARSVGAQRGRAPALAGTLSSQCPITVNKRLTCSWNRHANQRPHPSAIPVVCCSRSWRAELSASARSTPQHV